MQDIHGEQGIEVNCHSVASCIWPAALNLFMANHDFRDRLFADVNENRKMLVIDSGLFCMIASKTRNALDAYSCFYCFFVLRCCSK